MVCDSGSENQCTDMGGGGGRGGEKEKRVVDAGSDLVPDTRSPLLSQILKCKPLSITDIIRTLSLNPPHFRTLYC